jgi:hypothetical protein
MEAAVRGGGVEGHQRVWASALRSPKDSSLTLLIVNDAERSWPLRISLPGQQGGLAKISSTAGARPEAILHYTPVALAGAAAEVNLEPFSLTVLTDTPLSPDGPGRW